MSSLSTRVLRVCAVQLRCGSDFHANFSVFRSLAVAAAGRGARIIFAPENTLAMINKAEEGKHENFTEEDHPILPFYTALARDLGLFLHLTTAVKAGPRLKNRSLLINPSGAVCGRYDKIHLFDVPKLTATENYQESKRFSGGFLAGLLKSPEFSLGQTICYDMRFPGLFRKLAQAGAEIIAVPSAFTVPTGKLHWEILLRARAIECRSFIVAAAQVGEHPGGRKTFGHSLIIDPDGQILAAAGDSENSAIYADLDLQQVAKAREKIPSLSLENEFSLETTEFTN